MEKKYLHDDGGSVNHEKREHYGDSSKAQKNWCVIWYHYPTSTYVYMYI